jgi:hypothetical protein
LVCFWLGCSTEEKGLGGPDAYSFENLDEPDAAVDGRLNKADRLVEATVHDGPPPPDAPVTPDGPPPPDLAPDKSAPVDQPLGAACARGRECRSGSCVDGVCCDTACDDGCSACVQSRSGRPDGTCGKAADREGKVCGRACRAVTTGPAVVDKVCQAGACVVPASPTVRESCRDDNPCVVAFCDNEAARCVKSTCPQQGTCCCRSANGQRQCSRQDQCKGERMCE